MPPDLLRDRSLQAGLLELPFTAIHAVRANELPFRHNDPFDRGMLGQTLAESFTFVSQDEKIRLYDLPLCYF